MTENKKLDISQSTGMRKQHLLNTTRLLNYLKDKQDDLNISAIVHGKNDWCLIKERLTIW